MKCARCNRKQLETYEYEYNNTVRRLCGNCATLTEKVHGKMNKVRGSKDSGNAAPEEPEVGNEPVADDATEADDNPTDKG